MKIKNALRSPENNGLKVWGLIFFINLIQGYFSPLLNDEPYYWLYSRHLAWGYFDHPPMIALLIRVGSSIFPGEFGVRLLCLALGSLTGFLIIKLIVGETGKPVSFKIAALLLFSSLFLTLYSFFALPDTPMLFFAALFLITYRRFIRNENLINSLLLGCVAALLLYSKYHGILLIGFTLISNISLLKRPLFYLASITALTLFIPHINWQFAHDFPTLRFQFFERAGIFKADNVFSYLGEQAAVTGPVILLLFSLLYKPKNQFQKTLKFNVAGIFLFFLLSSFKENVNVHWTAIAWPPMLCLSYLYITEVKRYRRLTVSLLLVNLLLVILLRIAFVIDILRIPFFNDKNPRLMAETFKTAANDKPLVFLDMYIEPADYMFYGGKPAFAVNSISYKKTQFNYLPGLEDGFQGRDINIISNNQLNSESKALHVNKGKSYFITPLKKFADFSNEVKISTVMPKTLKAGEACMLKIATTNTLSATTKTLFSTGGGSMVLTLIKDDTKESFSFKYPGGLNVNTNEPFSFSFKAPLKQGTYHCIFSVLASSSFFAGFNSNIYNCRVE